MKTSLYTLMTGIAEAGLPQQRADGSMAPGHNGPHGDPEQPSRNTGHWLMLWAFAHRETGDARFRDAAMRAADYLILPAHRPGGFTVHHRDSPGKDHCNGLMGPAFTLEALATGGVALGRDDLLDLARRIVEMHPYHRAEGLWMTREVDGSLPGFDRTLNHQIWFAATVAMVGAATGGTGMDAVRHFTDSLTTTMGLRPNGRIEHIARSPRPVDRLKRAVKGALGRVETVSAKEEKREIAYHFFSIYPLTFLHRHTVESPFWASARFTEARAYPERGEYAAAGFDPSFITPYIPAGFPLSFAERAYANQEFGPADPTYQRAMIARQFAMTYDPDTRALTRNSIDPVTQAARSYEMTRLADIVFDTETDLPEGALR